MADDGFFLKPDPTPADVLEAVLATVFLVLQSGALFLDLTESVGDARLRMVLKGVLFVPLYAFLLWKAWRVRGRLLGLLRDNPLLLFIPLLPCLSIAWSITPGRSAFEAGRLLVTGALVAWMLVRFDGRARLRIVFAASTTIVVLSFLVAIVAPTFGYSQDPFMKSALQGAMNHRVHLGTVSAVGVLASFLVARTAERSKLWAAAAAYGAAASLTTLVVSRAATPLVGLVVALSVLAGVELASRLRLGSLATLAGLALLLVAAGVVGWLHRAGLASALGKNPDLSGRTQLWSLVLDAVLRHPWLGNGYSAFWLHPTAAAEVRAGLYNEPYHAHNGALELMLEYGGIGLALVAAFVVAAYERAIRGYLRLRLAAPLVFITYALVLNLTEVFWAQCRPPAAFQWVVLMLAIGEAFQSTAPARDRGRAP